MLDISISLQLLENKGLCIAHSLSHHLFKFSRTICPHNSCIVCNQRINSIGKMAANVQQSWTFQELTCPTATYYHATSARSCKLTLTQRPTLTHDQIISQFNSQQFQIRKIVYSKLSSPPNACYLSAVFLYPRLQNSCRLNTVTNLCRKTP